jgi:hypothetical protein
MKFSLLGALMTIMSSTLWSQPATQIEQDQELLELYNLMQGSFNSEQQSQRDSTYFNISLHMYPIWKERGFFLYIEQALNSMQDKPYRQRVYKITRLDNDQFSSVVYGLKDEAKWVGKWKTPEAFDAIDESDLVLRDGCEVILNRLKPFHFKGETKANSCKSTLRGAAFASSEVEIYKGSIISWDRGMNADGQQVWGAEKGGYIFNKIN